ncbi:uncharacterized protein LOC143647600 [Tamandua tetradactyla]|uniref:uncharacterized protein LOC143647600 n=1 Tax=Tamandua tetradactyla TaxID=48850 RepID=UPI0040545DC4
MRRVHWLFLSCLGSWLLWPVGTTITSTVAVYNGTTGITTETSTVLPNTQTTAFKHSSQTAMSKNKILGTATGPSTNNIDSAVSSTLLTHSAVTNSVNGGTTTSNNFPNFTTSPSGSNDMTKMTNKMWSTTTIPTNSQGTKRQTSDMVTFNVSPTISGDSTSDDKMGLSTAVPASTSTQQASTDLQTQQAQNSKSTGKPPNDNSPSSLSDISTTVIPPAPPSTPSGRKTTESASQETSTSGEISTIVTSKESSTGQPVHIASTLMSTFSDRTISSNTILQSTLLPLNTTTQEKMSPTGSTKQFLPTSSTSAVTDTMKIVTQPSSSSAPKQHTSPRTDAQGLSPSDETATSTKSPSGDSNSSQRTAETLKVAGTFITTQRSTRKQADSVTKTLVSITSEVSTADSISGQTTPFHISSLVQTTEADSQMTISPVTKPTQESQARYSVSPATENIEIRTSLPPSSTATIHSSSNNVITKSAFPQTHQPQNRETTTESQMSTVTRVRTPHPSTSSSTQVSTWSISQETSSSGVTIIPSLPSVSHTTLPKLELLTVPVTKDNTLGKAGETTIHVTTRFSPVTSKISTILESGVPSTPSSTIPSIRTTSTVPQTQQAEGIEMTQGHDESSVSSLVLQQTIPPGEATTIFSSSSRDGHTIQSQTELFSTLTRTDKSLVPSKSTSTSKTSSYTWFTSESRKRQEEEGTITITPNPLTTASQDFQTHWTKVMETTENVQVSNSETSVTHNMNMAITPIPLATNTGQGSKKTITGGPTSQAKPLYTNNSPPDPAAVSHMTHTQGTETTQQSQTLRPGFPSTDTLGRVRTTTSSYNPSQHSASETVPLDISTTGTKTNFTATPHEKNHITRAPTKEQWVAPTRPEITLENSRETTHSPTSIIAQVTSVVSVSGSSGGQAATPSSSTSTGTTSVISHTHPPQGIESTGTTHTSKSASLLTDTTWEGKTTTSSSAIISQTTSGSTLPEGLTSSKTSALTQTLTSDSHTTPFPTQLLSIANSLDTTQGTMGDVSVISPSTISPTISEASSTQRSTGKSITTSFSTSSQGSSSISQMAQTKGSGNTSGSETISSVSLVTDTFSTAASPTPPSASKGYSSPQAMAHTLTPASPIVTFSSATVSDSHRSQTAMTTSATGSTEGPPVVNPDTISNVTSLSPSTTWSPNGDVLPTTPSFSEIHINAMTVHPEGSDSASLTENTQVPSSSASISGEPTTGHPLTAQSVTSDTEPTTGPTYVSSTSSPIATVGTTLTPSDEPDSHSLTRTTVMTDTDASNLQGTTLAVFTPKPTSTVSPSSDADIATALWTSPNSPVTSQGNPGHISPTRTQVDKQHRLRPAPHLAQLSFPRFTNLKV